MNTIFKKTGELNVDYNLVDYKPRLTVELTEEHKKKLDHYFGEHGRKKEIIFVIFDDLFRLVEKHGVDKVVGALVERAISLKEICKLELKE